MELDDTEQPEKAPTGRPRRLRTVDLKQAHRQLLVVLKREILNLMDESHKGKLSQESSRKLINYMKLLNEPNEPKAPNDPAKIPEIPGNFVHLTDEELKALATKPQHGDQNE